MPSNRRKAKSHRGYAMLADYLLALPNRWISVTREGMLTQGLSLAETRKRLRRLRKEEEAFLIYTPDWSAMRRDGESR